MRDKALDTVRRYAMFTRGDTLTVGLSGGADSVALLHFLSGICQEWDIRLIAAHLNHNLRGAESRRDEDFVRDFCGKIGVQLEVSSLDIAALAAESGLSLEECAREERYRFFSTIAGERGIIATAHTLDDSAETQLLNLTRGTGLRGLCGIPPVRGNVIRPLIRCSREEVEAYCREHGLSWVTDSSNFSDMYTRNRLRRHVLPVLKEINPAFLRAVGHSMEILRREEEYLASQADAVIREIAREDGGYDIAGFLGVPSVLAGRVLAALCRERGVSWDYDRISRLTAIAAFGSGAEQLSRSLFFLCENGRFYFRAPSAQSGSVREGIDLEVDLLPPEAYIPWKAGKSVKISRLNREDFEYIYKFQRNLLKNALDYAKIDGIVTLRTRKPGDALSPAGRGCTKSLKKLFQENKIPVEKRGSVPVLAGEDGGLLWVLDIGAGELCRVTDTTQQVLLIEMLEVKRCEMTSGMF